MTKEDIKTKLEEFLRLRKTPPYKKVDILCNECGIRKLTKRKRTVWGKRNLASENHHWEDIKLNEYNPNKPVVVCLSGDGTKNEAEANGICKRTEIMLELLFKGNNSKLRPEDYVDIVSCAYGHDTKYLFCPDSEEFRKMYPDVNQYAKDFPEALIEGRGGNYLSNTEIQEFVEFMLLPRCFDKGGKRLTVDECCRNVSQVTFFTYCYGAQALNHIMESFDKRLLSEGFSREEVNQIKSSMSHVSFARKHYTRTIPSTFFYAVNDYSIGSIDYLRNDMLKNNCQLKTRLCKTGEKAFGQEVAPKRFGDVDASESLEFAYMGIEEKENFVNNDEDHFLSNMDRDGAWDIVNKKKGVYDAISQMMAWALCRSVENGLQNAKSDKYIPRMPMEALQEELIDIYNSFSQEDLMTKE